MFGLDEYTLKARLFPSVLAVVPALSLATVFVATTPLGLPQALVTFAVLVLVYTFSDVGRRFGKAAERRLFAETGGRPAFSAIRRSGSDLSASTKDRCRSFLSEKIGQSVPSAYIETHSPRKADDFYRDCAAWLREQTRDTKRFKILFNENITYGFRRNLYGMKWFALPLNLVVVVATVAMLIEPRIFPGEPPPGLEVVVLVIAAIHGSLFTFGVSANAVREASDQYERQLALSCETLLEAG